VADIPTQWLSIGATVVFTKFATERDSELSTIFNTDDSAISMADFPT
jgi:hypothetical protein